MRDRSLRVPGLTFSASAGKPKVSRFWTAKERIAPSRTISQLSCIQMRKRGSAAKLP